MNFLFRISHACLYFKTISHSGVNIIAEELLARESSQERGGKKKDFRVGEIEVQIVAAPFDSQCVTYPLDT